MTSELDILSRDGTNEEQTARAPRRAGLVAGGARRPARRLASDGQRARDGEVRPELAARVQDRAPVRSDDRGDLRSGGATDRAEAAGVDWRPPLRFGRSSSRTRASLSARSRDRPEARRVRCQVRHSDYHLGTPGPFGDRIPRRSYDHFRAYAAWPVRATGLARRWRDGGG